jgi:threonine dehydrogenase-like Zn-dependent dehydrogenase
VRPDIERVLVYGAGPIGLGIVAMARLLLGDDVPVLATDLSPYRLSLAEQLGAIPDAAAGGDELGEVDVAFDATGHEEARRSALDSLGKRGVLVCVGQGHVLRHLLQPSLRQAGPPLEGGHRRWPGR